MPRKTVKKYDIFDIEAEKRKQQQEKITDAAENGKKI